MIYFLLCIFLCRQTWLCFVHVFSLLLLCFSFICFMFRVLARSNQARSPSAKQQFRPRIEWYEEMPVPATGTSSSSQQNLSDCKCPKTIAKGSLAYLLTHSLNQHALYSNTEMQKLCSFSYLTFVDELGTALFFDYNFFKFWGWIWNSFW